jgi:hypothetical protein
MYKINFHWLQGSRCVDQFYLKCVYELVLATRSNGDYFAEIRGGFAGTRQDPLSGKCMRSAWRETSQHLGIFEEN